MRSRRGAKPMDLPSLRELFTGEGVHAGIALVTKPDGSNDHYEILDGGEDVIVSLQLMPHGQPAWGRLASFAGGAADLGLWRIPPVGAEVVVIYQDGSVDGEVFVVATLSTGAVPSDLDATTLILTNAKKVKIKSTDETIEITAGSGKDVSVNGGTAKVSRVGDATAGHVHAAGALMCPNTGTGIAVAVTGSTASATDTMNEGAEHFKA